MFKVPYSHNFFMIYAITKFSSTVSVADPNLEVSVWPEKIRGSSPRFDTPFIGVTRNAVKNGFLYYPVVDEVYYFGVLRGLFLIFVNDILRDDILLLLQLLLSF